MPAGTENLYVGQTKVATYDLLAPSGALTPPPGPTFALDNPVATASNGTVTATADPTKFTVPVTLVGESVGTGTLSTSLAGVDQGDAGKIIISVTAPPPDTGSWDASTLS